MFYLTFGTCLIFHCALVAGCLNSRLYSPTLTMSVGAIVQIVVLSGFFFFTALISYIS
uniref:Uncharacterized protein n=1 Tax=Arundo donax TaxID=35708 RepID=A0A0A9EG23_ARUDO